MAEGSVHVETIALGATQLRMALLCRGEERPDRRADMGKCKGIRERSRGKRLNEAGGGPWGPGKPC